MEKGFEKAEGTPRVKRAETRIPDELLEKQDLSLSAKVILGKVLGLWKNCGEVYISNDRLSRLLGSVSKDTVKRAKRELTRLGLITISQEEKGKGYPAYIIVDEPKVNDYLGFDYFQVKGEKKGTANTQVQEEKKGIAPSDIPYNYLAPYRELPEVLKFKDNDMVKKIMKPLAQAYGEGNIPQHFLDEIEALKKEAKKCPYAYDAYKQFVMKKK